VTPKLLKDAKPWLTMMSAHARTLIVAILLVTAGMAGCIGDGDDGATDPQGLDEDPNETEPNATDEPDEPMQELTRTWFNGSIEGGSIPSDGYYCTQTSACENTMEFEVAGGAQAIVVEAAWEADANAWFNVSGPNCESFPLFGEICTPSDNIDGASPLALTFEGERTNHTGTWSAEIWVDETTTAQIEPTIVATVVEEGQLPQGYSALPANGSSS
jgi:hypothetical protein